MSKSTQSAQVAQAVQSTRGPGRPRVYTGRILRHIVALVRKTNASTACEQLRANANSRNKAERALAEGRPAFIPAEGLTLSMPTVLRLCKESGVKLQRGRPRIAA